MLPSTASGLVPPNLPDGTPHLGAWRGIALKRGCPERGRLWEMVRGVGRPYRLLPREKVPWRARCRLRAQASRAPCRMRGRRQGSTSSDTADAVSAPTAFRRARSTAWVLPSTASGLVPPNLPDGTPHLGAWRGIALKRGCPERGRLWEMVRGVGRPYRLLPREKVPWRARCRLRAQASRAPCRMRGRRQGSTSSDTADAVPPSPEGEGKGLAHSQLPFSPFHSPFR